MSETVGEAKKAAIDARVAQCKALTRTHCFPDFGKAEGHELVSVPIPGSVRACRHCGLEERLLWGHQ